MSASRIFNSFQQGHSRATSARNNFSGDREEDLDFKEQTDFSYQNLEEQKRDELFQLFIENVEDYAIFTLDVEGRVRTWNIGAERMKGYTAAEILGQHFCIFFPAEDIEAGKPAWELEVAARDGRIADENWRIRKDGSRFWANVITTAVRDEDGALVGFSKITRDCTDQMLAKKTLDDAQQRLLASEQSLRELSLTLLRTHDEERRLLGREMHDSLGQYLVVLKMKLEAISALSPASDASVLRQQAEDCVKLLEECIREVQTVSYLLYPPMLDELGLKSAVPWYLDGFSKRSGIQTSFEAPGNLPRLTRDTELALFRVLQESLTNIHKHSGSRTADVRILTNGNSVILEVLDQGKGLPSAILEESGKEWAGSTGVGLRGMSERLRQLGGTLKITSSQAGTRLRAVIPTAQTTTLDQAFQNETGSHE